MKAAFFSRYPLGDGVNSLLLSHTLHLNDISVDTYHNTLPQLQNWVPHLPIIPYPPISEIPALLDRYDLFFIVWDAKTPFITELVSQAKRRFPARIKVLYLYPSKNVVNEPYYSDCLADSSKPVAENYRIVCRDVLHLPKIVQRIDLTVPEGLEFRKYPNRIVLHPTGSGPAYTNWPKPKFLRIASHLKSLGYEVVLLPGVRDLDNWKNSGFEVVDFTTLDPFARYLYESGYLVGSDSGPGHLASFVGIPTLTICRRKALANLWAPSLAPNVVLTPSSWIPNVRGMRFRDRYWKRLITVGMVRRGFDRLYSQSRKIG